MFFRGMPTFVMANILVGSFWCIGLYKSNIHSILNYDKVVNDVELGEIGGTNVINREKL
jgi:hypothetical protein